MQTKLPRANIRENWVYWLWASLLLAQFTLSGCASLQRPEISTPFPTEVIPTIIALTLNAGKTTEPLPVGSVAAPNPSSTKEATATWTTSPPEASRTPPPNTPTNTSSAPTATPYTLPPPPTPTPVPAIPKSEIEIRNLGPLSRVASPIHAYSYLRTGADGRVTVELLGEDNRLLYREVKVIDYAPAGGHAVFLVDIDFEIPGTAEVGRLRLIIKDEHGRAFAINSVPLILLSIGDSDIVPPFDVLSKIVIQEPTKRKLIQGGKVLVSGLARLNGEGPLLVTLTNPDGKIIAQRLVSVAVPPDGGYGHFAVEVPYDINSLTNALVTVTEGAPGIDDVIHLASVEVMLSP